MEPKNLSIGMGNLFNGKKHHGEHFRIFPISNWTEMDVWQYISKEKLDIPQIYFTHKRDIINRDGALLAKSDFITLNGSEVYENMQVRFRTVGDMTCTGAVESSANSIDDIIQEVASARVTERGGRIDDKRSEASMEDRKKQGYF